MDMAFYIIVGCLTLVALWLAILATIAVRYDTTLNSFQRKAQTIFIWLIPFLGAAFVLHLVWQHYPDAIPKNWIPWPFRKMIYGKNAPPNKNRNDYDCTDTTGSVNRRNDSNSWGGGDGGGGD